MRAVARLFINVYVFVLSRREVNPIKQAATAELSLISLGNVFKKYVPNDMSDNITPLFCQRRLVLVTSRAIWRGHLSLSLILQSEL